MSLEGRLRDLGLPEVYQLLGSSRKSGTLRVHAPLQAHAAEVRFVQGMIADAAQWPLDLTRAAIVPDRPDANGRRHPIDRGRRPRSAHLA